MCSRLNGKRPPRRHVAKCVCSQLQFLVPSLNNKLPEITLARPSGAVTAIEAGPSTGVILSPVQKPYAALGGSGWPEGCKVTKKEKKAAEVCALR